MVRMERRYMLRVSRLLSKVEFTLKGTGEDQGDVWECIFNNGRYQMRHQLADYLNNLPNIKALRAAWLQTLSWKDT